MRRIFAVVVGLTLAVLAACSGDGGKPAAGAPVCADDTACGSGVCDPFRGCVECRASSQCQASEVCLGGSCRAAQACVDNACPDPLRCDPGSKTCVDCLSGADCQGGAACVNGACQPASVCRDAAGCRAGTVCDLALGECVECLGSRDCAPSERCVEQRCSATCSAESGCGAGLRCDPLLNLCVECVASSDCADAQHCSDGRCLLDTCVAGAGTCDAMGQAVQLCSAAGDRVLPLYCGKHASCEGEPGKAACSDWVCTPGVSVCNAQGQLETCAMDGLSLQSSVDCAANKQTCVQDKCVDIACEPGSVTCDAASNSLHLCSANGTVDSVSQCAVDQYCDVDLKACKTKLCTPGVEACQGNEHGVCNALGSAYDKLIACKANQTCVDATCMPLICTPFDNFCGEDGNVYNCSSNGTVAIQTAICEGPGETGAGGAGGAGGVDYYEHCEHHGTSAACYADPCTKGQKYCDQNRLQTCNALGTGPADAGTDCGNDAVCVSYPGPPNCAPKICTPLTRFCDAQGNSQLCSSDGTSSSSWEVCGAGTYCDPMDAYCRYQTCTPSAPGCNGTVATTCKADGSTWEGAGTDCAASNKVCDAGACKAKVCEPNSYFCKAGNVNYCSATGAGSSVAATCAAAEYCSDGYSYCLADQCTGGQPVCTALGYLATCKADGSGPNGVGTACGASKVCDTGQCKSQVCTPNSLFCQGGHVQQCDSFGLTFSQNQYCFADQFCKTNSPTSASCEAKVCTTGAKGCNGEVYATCDALGSGYLDSPTNCAASSKVCSPTGCATSAVDEMGDSSTFEYFSTDSLTGDVFLATASRTLSKLEFESYNDLSGLSVHWAVYSSANKAGPYTPEFDVITAGALGFQSSGAIAVPLTAGRYYLTAVQLTGSTYYYIYKSNALTPPMSFGQPVGWVSAYGSGTLPASVSNVSPVVGAFHFRFTTKG